MFVLSRPPRLAPLRSAATLAALSLAFLAARPAVANDPKVEAEAKKLQQDAMDIDFLGLELKKAKDKLQKALKKCGQSKCSKPLLATLHRDLGIVLLNAGEQDAGEAEILAAVENDPKLTIGKDYLDNGAVKKAWQAAKGKGGVDAGGGVPALADGGLGVTVQLAPIGYELPIVITVPDGLDVKTVKVSYKTDTIEKYRQVEAKKSGGKWLLILPCDITAKPTTIKFFVKAYDDTNSELEHYGTIKKPGVVKVVDSMPDEVEAPALPGGKEPKECAGGAGGDDGKKPEGAGCSDDDECGADLVCVENDTGKKWCKPGAKKAKGDFQRLWVGLDGEIDLVFLGAERNLCTSAGVWACSVTGADGQRYDVTSSAGDGKIRGLAESAGKTDGGMAVATKRTLLSLDYFTTESLSIGLRLGWAFGGNPTKSDAFVPFHAEGRVQYFIATGIFRPFFLFNVGFGQFDAPVPNVIVKPQDPAQANACLDGAVLPCDPVDNAVLKGVTAHRRVGPGFAGVGLGVWVVPTSRIAINLAVKGLFPIPNFSFTVAPELGLKVAF